MDDRYSQRKREVEVAAVEFANQLSNRPDSELPSECAFNVSCDWSEWSLL